MVSRTPTKRSSTLSNPTTTPQCSRSIKSKIKATNTKKKKKSSSSSPLKTFTASIDRSALSCRRRLFNLFARFTILRAPYDLGFRRLQTTPTKHSPHPSASVAPDSVVALPPPSSPWKKTIFFDLDETLVHSQTDPPTKRYDFTVYPSIDGRVIPFYVLKRPGTDELLRAAAGAFEVVVFTAGLREYASLVLDHLDPNGDLIAHRLYRDSCKEMEGKFVKDLSATGRALDRAVIVDDNPNAYIFQPENALPVAPFSDDLEDKVLTKVMKFFEVAALFDDIRDAVAYYRSEYGEKKLAG